MKKKIIQAEAANAVKELISLSIHAQWVHIWTTVSLGFLQVVGAVGFMNHRLEIPEDVDPQWASINESCWHMCAFFVTVIISFFFSTTLISINNYYHTFKKLYAIDYMKNSSCLFDTSLLITWKIIYSCRDITDLLDL